MPLKCSYYNFTAGTSILPNYDPTKDNIGSYILKQTGNSEQDRYISYGIPIARPAENNIAFNAFVLGTAVKDDNTQYVVLGEGTTAAVTRRVHLYKYIVNTKSYEWVGVITLNWALTGNKTIRDIAVFVDRYTTGTVSVSGTSVTGSSTEWQTARLASGARIGFGSTDPNQISQWYEISSITSNTSLTLSSSAGTLNNVPYVIEEMRLLVALTSSVTTNGGLFLVKGIHEGLFNPVTATAVAEATADNVRGIYWLRDATTTTMTTAAGITKNPKQDWQNHKIYFVNGNTTTNLTIYAFNIRAALTVGTNGSTQDAFLYQTGTVTVTGSIAAQNCCVLATTQHGFGQGISCLYLVTGTRWYCIRESDILSGSTTYLSSGAVRTELPPGGTATWAVAGTLSSLDYDDATDTFFISTSGSNASRVYATKFVGSGVNWERMMFGEDRSFNQSASVCANIPKLNMLAVPFLFCSKNGILHAARAVASTASNQMYAIPVAADFWYADANNQVYISPAIPTTGALRFNRAFVQSKTHTGDNTWDVPTENFKVYYRTSGITDNSGSWTELSGPMSMLGVDGADYIQFKIVFKVVGNEMTPPVIYGLGVLYEDSQTSNYWEPSVTHSSIANKRFAWRFKTAYGSDVPTLYVKLYDAVTGNLLVSDNTASPTGTWEKSTNNGATWTAYNNSDKTNETTYIRYTPASIADNVKVKALLI